VGNLGGALTKNLLLKVRVLATKWMVNSLEPDRGVSMH
jgi:hypothetical protein